MGYAEIKYLKFFKKIKNKQTNKQTDKKQGWKINVFCFAFLTAVADYIISRVDRQKDILKKKKKKEKKVWTEKIGFKSYIKQ